MLRDFARKECLVTGLMDNVDDLKTKLGIWILEFNLFIR